MLARRLDAGGRRRARPSSTGDVLAMQRAVEQVHVVRRHRVLHRRPRHATRNDSRVQVARALAALALLKLARARAALDGRDFVTPEDVKAVAVPALAHRLMLRPGALGAAGHRRGRRPRGLERCRRRPPRTRPRRLRAYDGAVVQLLAWARELAAVAQSGLAYEDSSPYDRERDQTLPRRGGAAFGERRRTRSSPSAGSRSRQGTHA